MKTLAPLALCLALASCNSMSGGIDWVDYGQNPMENEQYMADMQAAGTPGPQHTALASRAGTWKVEGQMWMAPGADPMPMPSTAVVEVMLGGRYIVETFKSDFMGMPFEGRLTQGYDNVTGRYWSIWMDNMSTGYWLSHGRETSPGTVEFHGQAVDVWSPGGRPMRMLTTKSADGSYTMKMFDRQPGTDEFQTMELRYVKQ